jgi:hypothetical protein
VRNRTLLIPLLLLLAACERRDRLSAPRTVLAVSPTTAAVKAGTAKAFTARVITPSGEALDVLPDWALSSTVLGTLSPATGLSSTFTAGQTLGAQGTLTVTYGGQTAQAQVTVVSETGNPSSIYGFYSETATSAIKFDTANPSDPDGGFLGAFQGQGSGGSGTISLQAATGAGEFTEGSRALKASVTGTNSLSYGGYYMSFGYPDAAGVSRDLSAFATGTVKFDLKAPAGATLRMKLESTGASGACTTFCEEVNLASYTSFDNNYRSVSIPVTTFTGGGVDMSQFETLVITAVTIGNASFSFYVDNLRFEQ